MTEEQFIQGIRAGKLRVFERFYDAYKQQFIAFMLGRQKVDSEEHAEDLYRMACAIVHNNIRAGKFSETDLTQSSLKTYLFQVGKYTLWGERRKMSPPLVFEHEKVFNKDEFDNYVSETDPTQEQLLIIRTTVNSMPMPCSKILNLRIFEKLESKEIARKMGYKNDRSAITQVHKCKEKLVAIAKERLNKYGYGF